MKNRIREHRELRGLSQAELARRLGTSAASVSRYEVEDSRINMPLLEKLGAALGCDPCELISDQSPAELIRVPVRGEARWIYLDRALHQKCERTPQLEAIMSMDDSMAPTAQRGDVCIIDRAEREILSDGLYALDTGPMAVVKRASHNAVRRTVTISNDNPIYPLVAEAPAEELNILGRVVGLMKAL